MKQKLLFTNVTSKLLVLGCFLLCNTAFGADYYLRKTGNWVASDALTWSSTASTGFYLAGSSPSTGDNVFINGAYTLTINTQTASCANLSFGIIATSTAAQTANIVFTGISNSCTLTVGGNLVINTSASNTGAYNVNTNNDSTAPIARVLNIYKSSPSVSGILNVIGDIVVGNESPSNNYLTGVTGSNLIKRLNTLNLGVVSTFSSPDVNISGNIRIYNHQIQGSLSAPNSRYNLSAVRLNTSTAKITLSGNELDGAAENSGKGYIKTFRKGSSEGTSDGRFYLTSGKIEFNLTDDCPVLVQGFGAIIANVGNNKPEFGGEVIYKSTSSAVSKVFPSVYSTLTIDNSLGGALIYNEPTNNVLAVTNFNLVSGLFSVNAEYATAVLSLTGTLFMKGGSLGFTDTSNFVQPNQVSVSYSDDATTSGVELSDIMGNAGFTNNNLYRLYLENGNSEFSFDVNSIYAGEIYFNRDNYQLNVGTFNADPISGTIVLDGNNSVYSDTCVFVTPKLEVKANSSLLSPQNIRTTFGNIGYPALGGSLETNYLSRGEVRLGNSLTSITLTLGADLSTTNVFMEGSTVLERPTGIENVFFNVYGLFTLSSSSSVDLTSSGILTLKSTKFQTASISQFQELGGFPINGKILGSVNVERYLDNYNGTGFMEDPSTSQTARVGRYWRLLTAPVTKLASGDDASIFLNWQNNGLPITRNDLGLGTDVWGSNENYTFENDGIHYLSPGTHNFRKFDSDLSTLGGWLNVTNSRDEQMATTSRNNAFLAFVIAPFNQGVNFSTTPFSAISGSISTVLSASGQLVFGSKIVSVKKSRYYLLGNPYASAVNISTIIASNTSAIQNKIWLLDPYQSQSGGYITALISGSNIVWSNADSLHGKLSSQFNQNIIQSGEGFFVRGTNVGANAANNFIFGELMKNNSAITASPLGRYSQSSTTTDSNLELLRVSLRKVVNNSSSNEDGSTVVFYSGASNDVDDVDAEKFTNPGATLSFINNTYKLAIENRAPVLSGDELFINVSNATANTNYKLKIYTENFTFSGTATLHDLKLGTTTVMPIDGSIFEYPFTVTSDATTQGTRFKIVFGNAVLSIDDNANVNGVRVHPNPVDKSGTLTLNLGKLDNNMYNYRITNILGQTIQIGKFDKTELNQEFAITFNTAFSAGLYAIDVLDQNKVVNTSKIIIK